MASRIFIRGVNWLGDTVLSLPTVEAIRQTFPRARITLLCPEWLVPFWTLVPHIDRAVGFSTPRKALIRSFELRKESHDLAVVFPNSYNSAFCARLCGAQRRIGLDRRSRGFLFTDAVPVFDSDLDVHQVYYYLKLMTAFNCRPDDFDPVPELAVPEDYTRWFRKLLDGRPAIGINPCSGQGTARLWLAERFADLAGELGHAFPDHAIVFFGTPSDLGRVQGIVDRLDTPVINLAGRTGLLEFLGALSCLSLYITNDNGSMHAACALGLRVVTIFGSSDPGTTGPFSRKAIVVRKEIECSPCIKKDCPTDLRCMTRIEVDDVMSAVTKSMGRTEAVRAE
ncbi:lipopolysaccharide heptosyltransferase II [Acidobacteriota bacterium]